MDDGTEGEVGPGDAGWIAPGHDASSWETSPTWGLDFTGAADYAKR